MVRVNAARKPERCVPPSCVLMLFANVNTISVVGIVPLQRDLGVDAVLLALHEDRLLVDDRLVLVQVLHERDDAAFVLELVILPVALVVDRDENAAIEKGELTQALRQRVEAVLGGLEDLRVRPERDLRATPLRRAGDLERRRSVCRARSFADTPGRCARSPDRGAPTAR